ncbi:hypothetical protein C8J28_109160 [Cereibacter azotoformans]|uniref:Restriction endonuclease n=2 Tax=Cereibacter azotoformans TaxID=43057 RepID=A0A2T5K708_9RHOB|nr:hypothetical protein C8J28_109160 [Cereibacter azotoformans]
MSKKKIKDDHFGHMASDLIRETFLSFLADPVLAASAIDHSKELLGQHVISLLDVIIATRKGKAYREVVLIQTAFALVTRDPDIDLTLAVEGARDCGKRLFTLLNANHVSSTKDAYQSIGKNFKNLVRGVVGEYDEFLEWTRGKGEAELRAAFDYVAANLAAMSKPVKPMPDIDQGALDFGKVVALVNDLLDRPSQGCYQQYLAAAVMEAAIEEFGAGGINGFKADTKSLNATDATSKVSGDVQIRQRGSTIEAFEVTANAWTSKAEQALVSARDGALRRIHVLASVSGGAISDTTGITGLPADISVLDLKAFLHVAMAFLQKPTRASALRSMYQLLSTKQFDLARVNDYVDALEAHGLVMK